MLEDALKFRDREIPCDVIGLEPGWMETYYDKSVNKKFDKDRFWLPEWLKPENNPHQDTFFGALDRMGFKLSLWLCCDYDLSFEEERNADKPFLGEKEQEEADYLPAKDDYEQDVNIGHHPISMDEYTVKDQPFFEHLKKFVDMGASAFKMDGAWQVNTHPDRKWGNGMDDVQMHNLYPLLLSKQMSTGFTEHTGKRSMIYSSGGFAGIQKYAATWAGDTGGGPRPLASMLNHAMSGHVNTSCDMLAFTKEGMHFGFLQSWSQLCSWAYRRHPWYLGKELEGVFKSYARLRYSLLPYIYSTAYTAWLDSLPIMRPLPFAYPGDDKASAIKTQYMLGENLLVSCFTDELYLPEGVWTDYFTNKTYNGPVEMRYGFPEGRGGGLFVKQGAILPTVQAMDYIGDKPMDELIVDVFPYGDSRFTIYDDDGISMEYANGAYSGTTIHCAVANGMISIESKGRNGSYKGMPDSIKAVFRVRCSEPSGLSIDGKSERFDYVDGCAIFEIEDIAKGFSVEIHTNIMDGDRT
jgi:alpha-glucosidase (family GH31 glycosyl hydrolase)